MFAGRWTAIQNQFATVASKLGYKVLHNLDIHAFLRSTNSYEYNHAAPPKQYSRITPLMSMDTQYRAAPTPNERHNLQRSFDMFTQNKTVCHSKMNSTSLSSHHLTPHSTILSQRLQVLPRMECSIPHLHTHHHM